MKKFLSIALMLSLVAALFSGCYDKKTVINVYNWGEYISDGSDDTMDVIEEFNKTHPNIKAVYSTFASNEEMYAKIKSGGAQYDVVIPSDYMIGRMIEESMLEKLDYKNIPNYSYIMDDFKGQKLDFDPTG
ncbi:MAG: putative Bacterial extracellular solute-binding protein, partial [Oscillospiraceae bacterium]|nr:putative Bacterial extracellular solute-binding protein [Oscillospiraceae bacterium]